MRIFRLLVAVLLAVPSVAQAPPIERAGKQVTVQFHPDDLPAELAQRLADQALAAAESAFPVLQKLGVRPKAPMTIHVYAAAGEFRTIYSSLSKARYMMDSVCARDGSAAHAVLGPQLPPSTLELLGLPPSMREELVRCVARLAALAASVPLRFDPWLTDVFAFGVQEAATNPKAECGLDPAFDDRRKSACWQLAEGRAVRLTDWIDGIGDCADRDTFDYLQACAAVAAQALAAKNSSWARKVLASSSASANLGVVDFRRSIFENVLGKDWPKTEIRFSAMLKSMRPVWSVSRPMVALDPAATDPGQLVMAGTKSLPAVLDYVEHLPKGGYCVRCRVCLQGHERPEVRFNIDGDEQNVLAAIINPDHCYLSDWSEAKHKWIDVKRATAGITAGVPFDVAIELGEVLRVTVDGKVVLEVPRGEHQVGRHLGVAVNDFVVRLDHLQVEPLAARK